MHIIDPRTGKPIDPAATQAFLVNAIFNKKTAMLADMVRKNLISDVEDLQDPNIRNSFGDMLVPQNTYGDSGGNFAVYFTEVFDPFINKPLFAAQYAENITVEQAPYGAEATSFVNSQITGGDSRDPQRISFSAAQQTGLGRTSVEFAKTLVGLNGWSQMASFDVREVAIAQMNGLPLETAVLEAIGIKWEADLDIVAHLGAYAYSGTGLLNTSTNAVTASTKTAGGTRWVISNVLNATPQEILADVRKMETAYYYKTGQTRYATDLLIPPDCYAALTVPLTIGGVAAGMSLLEYIARNSVTYSRTGVPLKIRPNKFLIGTTAAGENSITVPYNATGTASAAGADSRAFMYTNSREIVRMKVTNPTALPIQYQGMNYNIPYVGQLPSGVEFPRSNTDAVYMNAI